jgi:uncharacterized membrane protein
MIYIAFLSYALIVNDRACERIIYVIKCNIIQLAFIYIVFIGFTLGLNLFIERKIEKRTTSKEYLIILIIHLVLLILGTIYASYEFYSYCGQVQN